MGGAVGRRLLAIVGVAVAAAILVSWAWAAGFFQVCIPTSGAMKAIGLEVYYDQACSVPLVSIDWGLLVPGESKSVICYVKSTSNVNASLGMVVVNWVPSQAADCILLVWNREASVIRPSEVLAAMLTLRVNSAIQGVTGFSFDIIVTASEAE